MKLPSPIPMDLADMIAARLRVIGDPNRIRILDQLREGELSVAQITERLGTSQQNASKHLGVLLQAGIVAAPQGGHERLLQRRRRASTSCASRSAVDCAAGELTASRSAA